MTDFIDKLDNMAFFGIDVFVVINLMVALACGVGIFTVFYITHRQISVNRSFAYTLILLPLISAMVSIMVSNNLVLAVGMLGALSIIRFRHSMKESANLVYVFWAVTTGLAAGLGGYRQLTILWCVIIGIIILVIHAISESKNCGLLTVKTKGNTEEIEKVLIEYSLMFETKYISSGEKTDMLYEIKRIKCIKSTVQNAICEKIMQIDGVSSVKYIDMR